LIRVRRAAAHGHPSTSTLSAFYAIRSHQKSTVDEILSERIAAADMDARLLAAGIALGDCG
jgi:hypothetical protein